MPLYGHGPQVEVCALKTDLIVCYVLQCFMIVDCL